MTPSFAARTVPAATVALVLASCSALLPYDEGDEPTGYRTTRYARTLAACRDKSLVLFRVD